MDDNGQGYPNTTKWDLSELQSNRRVQESDEQVYDESDWDSHTEQNFD